MDSLFPSLNRPSRWLKFVPLAAVMCLCAGPAQAVDDTFYNSDFLDTTTLPVNTLQPINATNFVNDAGGTFSWDFSGVLSQSWINSLYSGWHYTRNFTNNGEMLSSTGFRFDTQTSGHAEAGNFYNTANINCGSGLNSIFLNQQLGLINGVYYGGYGGIYVNATNIVNTGTITVGSDGLGRFIGENLDFTTGNFSMQNSFVNFIGQTNTVNIYAVGETGTSTNNWYPDQDLTATTATSGIMKGNLFQLSLYNSKSYFSVDDKSNPTNWVIRMVFIQNSNTNVPYNVYHNTGGGGLGLNGFTTIEWIGAYLDPVTGSMATNYLYLSNDYIQGSSTNILKYVSGVPNNYTFQETASPLALGTPVPSSFPAIFNSGQPFPANFPVNTNIYSYMDAQLIATTITTNAIALTNIPGRFEFTANKELNLTLTRMSGMNYVLLKSTNNFDYDGQSEITAPYADLYLGKTNQSMTLTNLLLSSTPFWNGEVQAWNTRWFYTDTNSGITLDYRVVIVGSQLEPTTPSYQQDVVLYATNNVVISDALSVYHTLSLNCTNLTITANGEGALSPSGTLNLLTANMFWATCVPKVRCLTNDGAISTMNLTKFGSAALPYLSFVNTGSIINGNGTAIVANNFENSGSFYSGGGSFTLAGQTATLSGGTISANGAFSSTSDKITIAATSLSVGKSITLNATNLLTDHMPFTFNFGWPNQDFFSGNFWSLGSATAGSGGGFTSAAGLVLPIKPVKGDLLNTTIYSVAPSGTLITHTWAGQDRGYSPQGFTNNAAIGQLLLDAQGPAPHTGFYFAGTGGAGVTNAIYVDNLQLLDNATNGTLANQFNPTSLIFSNNLVIYYAQAMMNGSSIAEKLNHGNNDHLRWVSTYAGTYSSTNITYPSGETITVNAALAQSSDIDSDGDGIVNSEDTSSPFFLQSQIAFSLTFTKVPPLTAQLQWTTIPNATNYVWFKTNLLSSSWTVLTNFPSLLPYPSAPAAVTFSDPVSFTGQRFYRVSVVPWLTYPF